MGRGRKKLRRDPDVKPSGIPREEQGDLLVAAVSQLLSPEREGAEEAPEALSGIGENQREPEVPPKVVTEEGSVEGDGGKDAEDGAEEEFELESEEEASASAETIPDSPWEQKIAWAKERVRDGLKLEALGLYRELVAEQPTSVRALNNLGILLDEMGEHEEATLHLTRAAEVDPENMEVLGNLGTALGALGRYSEADDLLRKVLRHDPSNAEVRGNLGILFFRRGLYEQAEVELAAVCRDRPDYGLAHYYRGEALSRLDKVDAAIEALEKAIEFLPGKSRAYYSLGILFDLKNLPVEAAAMYRKSREKRDR